MNTTRFTPDWRQTLALLLAISSEWGMAYLPI
jgi:hypothetical protein